MQLNQYQQGNYSPGAPLIKQLLWHFVGDFFVQTPLLPITQLKVAILRLFGAQIGTGVNIKPHVKIKFPWRLTIGNYVWLGERCWIDNLAPVTIESHVCLSQGVYLCTGNHNWSKPSFDLIIQPIYIATGSWIGAHTIIGPGVQVNESAVLTLGSVAVKSLEAMTIYSGNPCQPIRKRKFT
ncbi:MULTISPECIES: WcaF family extracellular polysaccharide biosynthesis acetyltransferase [unclassified Synechocystis]|uniref:WcaF family extracellular polysaccharide biosynthesis acetyltransferase n=1 Tax=unclassified Synechocystis TaxID=2640012 RepID=UPI0004232C30|nr:MULTISPECIES: WcaF family extracellular polysaccharide biosynthesis acetyltransferase [unclassified Synechocystis]AIE74700.1 Acetyltransferase [Synechocystis sp. PCC 6714]MCT0253945.1 WcaF family extracellular polysaccharide biosynthesis acetyltransferase [Synechocystis sp. CS-94]